MASIYYGYSVSIVARTTRTITFQAHSNGELYDVAWPDGQDDEPDQAVQAFEPTTVPRFVGFSGMLFLKNGQARPRGLNYEVTVPGHELAFAQQQHWMVNVEVVSGGSLPILRQIGLATTFPLLWNDPFAHFAGAPWSTLPVERDGFPATGACGVVVLSGDVVRQNGLADEGGSKWPSALGLGASAGEEENIDTMAVRPIIRPSPASLDQAQKKTLNDSDWYHAEVHWVAGGLVRLLHLTKTVTFASDPLKLSGHTMFIDEHGNELHAVLGGRELDLPTTAKTVGSAYLHVRYACKILSKLP